MKQTGKLYGVGVGPGDKELLTLKAVRILQSADFIAIAHSGSDNVALGIVGEFIQDKPLILCPMPMTRNGEELTGAHNLSASLITDKLRQGFTVAFITLGDPSVYSTYAYLHKIILSLGFDVEIIPGVTSFCAAAAALNITLCEGASALTIIPAGYDNYEALLDVAGAKVVMKSGKHLKEVKNKVKEKGLASKAYAVSKCGMQDEAVYKNMDDLPDDLGYFTVMIIKD